MGKDIQQTQFCAEDYKAFRSCLNDNLRVFRKVLDQPQFGVGDYSFGAELELYIIDQNAAPLPINHLIHDQLNDPQLTLELNRFNLEYNFIPIPKQGAPFSKMEGQMCQALECLSQLAQKHDARILPIGILPTLQAKDMGLSAITDVPRYHVLAKSLREKRGSDFKIQIEGIDNIDMEWADVSLEGANTSFQFHYRVNPEHFADAYNAAQLTTPLALALGANSPFFMGKRLWQETRVALFKQSIDYRVEESRDTHLPARVLFGLGWVRKDIHEMFAEGVYMFDPLMPICSGDDPEQEFAEGKAPGLKELRLHQGSIWTWNRPIYDPADNGHLRIELRSLPAGPTPMNMTANAAMMTGLLLGLRDEMRALLPGLPFRYAEQNFYRAAKFGLNANLFWPSIESGTVSVRPALEIIKDLLPIIKEGLHNVGADDQEIAKQMGVIQGGMSTRTNGAVWQLKAFEKLRKQGSDDEALTALVEKYYENYLSGKPVHEWSLNV